LGLAPTELRERLVNVALANFKRVYGVELQRSVVERQVVAELELVAAARASGQLRESSIAKRPPAPPRDLRIDATDPSSSSRSTSRSSATDPDAPVDFRPRTLYANPKAISERWALACGRIARITQGTGIAGTHKDACVTADCPELARKFGDLFANYLLSRNPNAKADPNSAMVRHNPFWLKSDADAARMFMRMVEDICDESSARLGPWRVPK
jgi:hypothetical protein